MYRLIKTLLLVLMVACIAPQSQAQFLDRLAKHAEKKIKREAENRTQRRVDRGINKSFDKVEEKIDGTVKKKKKRKKRRKDRDEQEDSQHKKNNQEGNTYSGGDDDYSQYARSAKKNRGSEDESSQPTQTVKNKKHTPKVVWSKFDFVPGDEVIFEDAPSPMEENGEFPSRWDLVEGNVEIAEIDGETAIYMRERGGTIIPYLTNRKEDYLPDVFTIEVDLYFDPGVIYYELYLNDNKNQETEHHNYISVGPNYVWTKMTERKYYPGTDAPWLEENANPIWRHISIAYTRGKLKVYLDDTRLVNIPHYEKTPTGFTLKGNGNDDKGEMRFIKNVRIAKGGVKYYDRVMQDGKIIANGIRFDVGKTTLKPESMGPINKIYKLMTKKPDLKFSVEGHTDADGDDTANQTLSEGRAQVVMDKLVEMGINQDRLSSKGWGESKPIAGNDTPEGKANNRRVEFVVVK